MYDIFGENLKQLNNLKASQLSDMDETERIGLLTEVIYSGKENIPGYVQELMEEYPEAYKSILERVISTLRFREEVTIRERFGIGEDVTPATYKQIGGKFRVTDNRARQYHARGNRKLHYPSRKRMIKEGYDKVKELEWLIKNEPLMQETISELAGYFTEQPLNKELTDDEWAKNPVQNRLREMDTFNYYNFYTKY